MKPSAIQVEKTYRNATGSTGRTVKYIGPKPDGAHYLGGKAEPETWVTFHEARRCSPLQMHRYSIPLKAFAAWAKAEVA